jgi:hypothetical protein
MSSLGEIKPAMTIDSTEKPPDLEKVDAEGRFHPLFSNLDGDTILGAKGGSLLFRVHSYTLKTTSGWFRTMFSLPQTSQSAEADVIFLDEEALVLEALLRMICGQPILRLESIDMVDSVLFAAEKYDMPGPMSIGQSSYLL